MSIISLQNLTFGYAGSPQNVFENINCDFDSDWKLGLVGRNGRGKSTLLALLNGDYPYQGRIQASMQFSRYPFLLTEAQPALIAIRNAIAPFSAWEEQMENLLEQGSEDALAAYGEIASRYSEQDGYIIDELIRKECNKLGVAPTALTRQLHTLSAGERCKLMLAALFLRKNHFLLIDEPTNHLDLTGRKQVAAYLSSKKGFLLISHDRWFLDQTVDHIMALEKNQIVVQSCNYTTYAENKGSQDAFEIAQNERLQQEIAVLEKSSREKALWSDRIESSKIGAHVADRGYVGHKAAKMMHRSKAIEKRKSRSLDEKKALLQNVEQAPELTLQQLKHHQNPLIAFQAVEFSYSGSPVWQNLSFKLKAGDRICINGVNGSGKTTLLKIITGELNPTAGELRRPKSIIISALSQEISWLKGDLSHYISERQLPETLMKTILRKLDFSRLDFNKPMELYSDGMKKKVLLAASLATPAHLYLWDEPLNFIDIASRGQIENLILEAQPTLIFVEHDQYFQKKIATEIIQL